MKYFMILVITAASVSGYLDQSVKQETLEDQAVTLYLQQITRSVVPIFCAGCDDINTSKIVFYLYTRENPGNYTLRVGDIEALKQSTYNINRRTKFVIHGWFQEGNSFAREIKNAYLEKEDLNIISVEWSNLACCPYLYTATKIIPFVGQQTGKMIKELIDYGSDVSSFHVIGHSYGAQVASFAGKYMTPKKLPRITGLDPAGPDYNNKNASGRLDKSDADFVDVIHTNAYVMGTYVANGHANFYPNGGSVQMSCIPINVLCNHQLSVAYYVESIKNEKNFCSMNSVSYVDYLKSSYCTSNGEKQYMGAYVNSSSVGYYYLITGDTTPYTSDCKYLSA